MQIESEHLVRVVQYRATERAFSLKLGEELREAALSTWEALNVQVDNNASDDFVSVYHRRVQALVALATMEYARAEVLSA